MNGCKGKGSKEPRWKRRIKDSIAELRRHVNIPERSKQGQLKRKEKYTKLERKCNIEQKGEKVVIEELKQRLQAKSVKLKRYEQRIHRYQVNRLFQQDQKRVYQQINWTSRSFSEVRPDAEESQQFWRDIWGKEVLHNENAEWLKELKKERVEARQEDIVITNGDSKVEEDPQLEGTLPWWRPRLLYQEIDSITRTKGGPHEWFDQQQGHHTCMDDNWKDSAVSEKTKKEVVLLITIDPYPVYYLATTCLETDDRDHRW